MNQESGIETTVDFKWDPYFWINAHNPDFSVIIKEDTGWMRTIDGKWVQEDPSSPCLIRA